jgi:peptidoglycan hydrolase-like protein with peptidoglycan-binding domain
MKRQRKRCMKWLGSIIAVVISGTMLVPHASAQPSTLTYAQPLSQAGVMAVQQRLKQNGAYGGPTDGVWGPESAAALEQFQRANGLQVTGQLNQATVATLGLNPADLLAVAPPGVAMTPVPSAEPLSRDAIRAVQSRLHQLGFYSGRIDGIWGPSMQASLQRFQQGRGLQATGQLNPATVTALGLDPNNLAAPPATVAPAR